MSKLATERSEAEALLERIGDALRLVPDDDPGLFRHCVWEATEMIKLLNPMRDFSPVQMMAINVVLAQANSQRLGRPGPGITVPGVERLRAVG